MTTGFDKFCSVAWGDEHPLKSCPFCGGRAARRIQVEPFRKGEGIWSHTVPQFCVYCPQCGVSTDWSVDGYIAEDHWNKRVPPDVNEIMDIIKSKVEALR